MRSRLVEHLAGSRLHRTYPPAAAVYHSCLQIARHLRRGTITVADWGSLWDLRAKVVSTPLVSIGRCSKLLNFHWSDSTTLMAGPSEFSLCNAYSFGLGKQSHMLRDVLRVSGWCHEALRRPKDFTGAASGVDNKSLYAAYCVPCGPSLVTGGSWTKMRLYLSGLVSSPLCDRCGACADTKAHRLWWCEDNAPLLQVLLDKHPTLVVDELPPCLQRCGLILVDFTEPFAADVVQYLLAVSQRATHAFAKSALPHDVEDFVQPVSS